MRKPELLGVGPIASELVRMDPAIDGQMTRGRLQVLADGEDLHPDRRI